MGECKSCGWLPKETSHRSPPIGVFDSTDAMYVLGSESESEDNDMCVASDDEGPAPSISNRIPKDD